MFFLFNVRKQLVAASLLPPIDYGDIDYMNDSGCCLSQRVVLHDRLDVPHSPMNFKDKWSSLFLRAHL